MKKRSQLLQKAGEISVFSRVLGRRESRVATVTSLADIASQLQAAGFLVLASGEVESAAAAALLGLSPKTLRNMRSALDGPPWRFARNMTWYSIADVLEWRDGTPASFTAPGANNDPLNL